MSVSSSTPTNGETVSEAELYRRKQHGSQKHGGTLHLMNQLDVVLAFSIIIIITLILFIILFIVFECRKLLLIHTFRALSLATEETMVTQQVSHRPIKSQSIPP